MDSTSPSDKKVIDYVNSAFYGEYLEGLKEFVRIPSLSPMFDPEWETNGNLYRQCDHLVNFTKGQNLKGCTITALKDQGKSPFLIVNVDPSDAANENCVLLYGHMDKQPFGDGWDTDPQDPVIKDGKMWGRGSSDDGYAFFTALLSIKACQDNNLSHPRCVITIEGSEEGEIDDLLYYIKEYKHLMGKPNIVICLDSVANSQECLSITSSLRGTLNFDVKVKVASNNMHSGVASGICPNPFQIIMVLLQRLQNFETQEVIQDLHVQIPDHRLEECKVTAQKVPLVSKSLPMLDQVKTMAHNYGSDENLQLLINNFWKPSLSVIGFEGLPSLEAAGNVIYKELTARLSLRMPPTLTGEKAEEIVKSKLFEKKDDTFNAVVEYTNRGPGNGLDAPKLPEDISKKFNEAHQVVFQGSNPMFVGCGGSIPFMEVFSQNFPGTNFLLTGCGFMDSNAHSANENLDLEFCRKLTTVIALLLSKL